MGDKRYMLTPEEAIAMLPDTEMVHTFVQFELGAIVGADWSRQEIVDLICSVGVCELAGDTATSMGHGLVVWNKKSPLFVKTRKES